MGEKLRIYVGGLGSSVQDDDLRKTFSLPQLGTVETVEIIRSKGRSFAYLEFVPVSDKGLAKLFSTYNGCLWRGGKLRLEKAKEHYLVRLRREWTEDAELENKLSSQNIDPEDSVQVLQIPEKDKDIDKMQLNMFFPKLRRIRPIPLKGTGKHKYSFQRVEIPPLPIHFCDCEEHAGPPEVTKRNPAVAHENNCYGVNEEELDMMKSILNKLLESNCSKTEKTHSNEAELTKETNHDAADAEQVDESEEDQVSDEDNIVINIVGNSSKRVTSFEDWAGKTTAMNQDSLVRELESSKRTTPEIRGSERGRPLPDKKRKQFINENYSDNSVPSVNKRRKEVQHDSKDDPVTLEAQQVDVKSGSIRSSRDAAKSKSGKSAWRNLVNNKGSSAFHISDVLMDGNPGVEAKPKPDCLAPSLNEKDDQGDQSTIVKEDVQSAKPNAIEDKSTEIKEDVQSATPNAVEDNSTEINDVQSGKPNNVEDKFTEIKGGVQSVEPDAVEEKSTEVKVDVLSTKPSAVEDKSARGASWLQKSSWLQLVGDTNSSAFSLTQILPGVTFQKQETQQLDAVDFSKSRNGKLHRSVDKDQISPIEDIDEPQGRDYNDVNSTPENPAVEVPTKEQNRADLDVDQSNSGSKQGVEEKDESSARVHGTNKLPDNRDVGDIVISETCPFMRSAASMKEWAKTKAALSGAHKKKGKGKEQTED